MAKIILQAFNQGGVADSIYSGSKFSAARMIGWNIHKIPGVMEANQRMTKHSPNSGANEVNEFCKEKVECSNGIRYWFSSTSGKVWQEKNGTYTHVYTISPAAGSAAILGAQEHQGYIYIATQSRLHRIAVANADGAAAWTSNFSADWATFSNADSEYHPMFEVNLVLYIGDGKYVAQVDSGTFSANALDIESQYRVSALGKFGTDLLIGTIISVNVARCEVFRWNTYGVSFINQDTIYEAGINAFLEWDNYVVLNAGNAGNLYSYNGERASHYKKIPGVYSPTKQAKVYRNAVGLLNGTIPLIGVSNVQGNPCDQGVWSLGRHTPPYPAVMNLEYPISQLDGNNYNITNGVEIGALLVSGQDVYMSWSYNGAFGIDKLDYSDKILHPIYETRVMTPSAGGFTTFNEQSVTHEPISDEDISISMKLNSNGAGYGDALADVFHDSERNLHKADMARLESRTLQLRVEATTNNNISPVIQEIITEVS